MDECYLSSLRSTELGATATWRPDILLAGNHEVWVWCSRELPCGISVALDLAASYTVQYNGDSETIPLDQNLAAGQWCSLGVFPFAAETDGYVELVRNSTDGSVTSADAVKFRRVSFLKLEASPSTFSEGDGPGAAVGTVTRSGSTGSELVVNLSSLDTTEATVPLSVTIPEHASFAEFLIDAVNDDFVDGPQVAVIEATATGYVSAETALQVTDDDEVVEIIIDNLDSGFSTTGSWGESIAVDEYEGSSMATLQVGATARWTPDIPQAGSYEVYAWWSAKTSGGGILDRDEEADYVIHYQGGATATVEKNQEVDSGQWVLLGTFAFEAGTSGYVELIRDTASGYATSADAIRFMALEGSASPAPPAPLAGGALLISSVGTNSPAEGTETASLQASEGSLTSSAGLRRPPMAALVGAGFPASSAPRETRSVSWTFWDTHAVLAYTDHHVSFAVCI